MFCFINLINRRFFRQYFCNFLTLKVLNCRFFTQQISVSFKLYSSDCIGTRIQQISMNIFKLISRYKQRYPFCHTVFLLSARYRFETSHQARKTLQMTAFLHFGRSDFLKSRGKSFRLRKSLFKLLKLLLDLFWVFRVTEWYVFTARLRHIFG